MGRGFDQLTGLKDDAAEYLKLRWTSARLEAVDKISGGLAKALGYAVFVALALSALVFLMVALAIWIGEMLGHASLGFLIAGGGFLLAAAIVMLVGRRLFANTLVRYFVDLFFTDKDEYDHGTRK